MSTASAIVNIDEKKFQTRNQELSKLIDSIAVKDAESCLQMKTLQRDIRTEMKLRHAVLDPFVIKAKTNYDEAKLERDKWLTPLEAMDGQAALKVKDYERREREAAEAEQRRINDERRRQAEIEAAEQRKRDEAAAIERRKEEEKRIAEARKAGELNKREAERLAKEAKAQEEIDKQRAKEAAEFARSNVQEVQVKANIPTVAGVPSRRNYKAEVVDPAKLINAFVDAVCSRNTGRAVYLRQFIAVNEQALGQEARLVKDPKKLAALIPGVNFREE